jgi:hypothetical protein
VIVSQGCLFGWDFLASESGIVLHFVYATFLSRFVLVIAGRVRKLFPLER